MYCGQFGIRFLNINIVLFFYYFQHLDHWSRSAEGTERTRAIDCILRLLEDYYEHSQEDEVS